MNTTQIILGAAIGAIVLLVVLAAISVKVVREGEVGVRLNFGAAERTSDGTLQLRPPGLHWVPPWMRLETVNLAEQVTDLSAALPQTMAADGTVLRLNWSARHQVERNRVEQYLFGLRNPRAHVEGILACHLRNQIATMTAASLRQDGDLAATDGHAVAHAGSFAYLRRKRGEVSRQFVAEHRAAMLAAYGTDVGALDLLDVDPPEALADALNAVVRAEAEADENFFRASSECKQTVLAADHSLQLATTRAQAVQKEIETLGQYLEGLRANQQLTSYVQRRQHEVLKGARTTYVRTKESV